MSGLNINLLLVLTLTCKGFEFMFKKIDIKILRESILIVIGIVRERTYFLRLINTAFYIAEGKKAFMSESMRDIEAIYTSKKSNKNSQSFNQRTNGF